MVGETAPPISGLRLKEGRMRKHGKTIASENGYSVVEVYQENVDGTKIFLGYVILDADGNEIDFFTNEGDALKALKRYALFTRESGPSL